MGYLMIGVRWCGLGWRGGELPELRLGVLHLALCPRPVMEHLQDNNVRLLAAERAMKAMSDTIARLQRGGPAHA